MEYSNMASINPSEITVGAVGVVGGAVLGSLAGYALGKRKNRKRKRGKSNIRGKRASKGKRKNGRHTPYTAGKRADRSRRRIRYTKNGQPYVLGKNGKARFISKKSAKSSYKRKGGRY